MQIERMHPFDSRKFGKVMRALQNEGFFNAEQVGKVAACSPRDAKLKHAEAAKIHCLFVQSCRQFCLAHNSPVLSSGLMLLALLACSWLHQQRRHRRCS